MDVPRITSYNVCYTKLLRSDYGYWNGSMVMYVFIGLFALYFVILWLTNRNNQRIKQFNIVYAAERPARPETTHFAYNMFAHYRKAVVV